MTARWRYARAVVCVRFCCVALCLAGCGGLPAMTPEMKSACLPAAESHRGEATLHVTAQPDAHVCVDGRHAGSTPVTVRKLQAGPHDILLLYPGRHTTLRVLLVDGESKTVNHGAK